MAKHILLVLSNAVAGKEDDYNKWYNEQHLDDVLKVPGFVAAQRFELTSDTGVPSVHKYLAIYEMETDDTAGATAGLTKARDNGSMYISPGIDTANIIASVFTPMTGRVTKKK